MFIFRKKKVESANEQLCCLTVTEDAVAIALIARGDDKPHVNVCDAIMLSHHESPLQALETLVERYQLHQQSCSWVLNSEDYQLLQVDEIDVPADELKPALRWKVKDLLDMSIEDAALDVFKIPPHGPGNHKKLLSVVIARRTHLSQMHDYFKQAHLKMGIIDITALAILNLVKLYQQEDNSIVAALYLSEKSSQLLLVEHQQLYYVHRLRVPLLRLETDSERIAEAVTVEVQRIYDYCVSQLHLPEPQKLLLIPDLSLPTAFSAQLSQQVGGAMDVFDINQLLTSDVPLTEELQHYCLLALAGALRLLESDDGTTG